MASVLLIAPGVDSEDIGEAWVAYQWAAGLSDHHDVTLLTYRKRGRRSAVDQLPRTRVVEWDELPMLGKAERFNSLFKPWYPHFYYLCRKWIQGALSAGEKFDVAHQPVPVAMRYPSPLTGLGIPYVVGPVGGSMASPPGFVKLETSPWYMDLRRLDSLRIRRDGMLRRSYSGADLVLGIAPYVTEQLSSIPIQRLELMSETAVVSLPEHIDRAQTREGVRLLFVGRLIRTKAARDIIAALATLRDVDLHLDVVGDGFDRTACESLVEQLALQDRVTFHGSVPRTDVDAFYRAADIFVFPSYREPGGNVPFEAMSYALPLIVSDRGGPGQVVTDECGIRITPGNPNQFASDISAAIRELAGDRDRRRRMGAAARRTVQASGTWRRRVERMNRFYEEVMIESGRTHQVI